MRWYEWIGRDTGPRSCRELKKLKIRPEEIPVDVISRALEVLEDDDYIDEETEAAIIEGIEEYKAGKSISHEELGKELGFNWCIPFGIPITLERALRNLDPLVGVRIYQALEVISVDPKIHIKEMKRSSKAEHLFKFRVGDYRIIMLLFDDDLVILVVDAGPRKTIYKKYGGKG